MYFYFYYPWSVAGSFSERSYLSFVHLLWITIKSNGIFIRQTVNSCPSWAKQCSWWQRPSSGQNTVPILKDLHSGGQRYLKIQVMEGKQSRARKMRFHFYTEWSHSEERFEQRSKTTKSERGLFLKSRGIAVKMAVYQENIRWYGQWKISFQCLSAERPDFGLGSQSLQYWQEEVLNSCAGRSTTVILEGHPWVRYKESITCSGVRIPREIPPRMMNDVAMFLKFCAFCLNGSQV